MGGVAQRLDRVYNPSVEGSLKELCGEMLGRTRGKMPSGAAYSEATTGLQMGRGRAWAEELW